MRSNGLVNLVGYEFSHHPKLFNSTKLGQMAATSHSTFRKTGTMSLQTAGPCVEKNINSGTQHWTSTYRGTTADNVQRPRITSNRPAWSVNRIGYSSSRGIYKTEFTETIGNFGHVPRKILPHDAKKQENKLTEMTIGTQKVTSHIPGYCGFIPNTDVNEIAVNQSIGQKLRNTIIKQNIVENQHIRLPGYKGHKTMSVVNDRGSIRPKCLSTHGESFS